MLDASTIPKPVYKFSIISRCNDTCKSFSKCYIVFSGRYHIISNASLVNNCIMSSLLRNNSVTCLTTSVCLFYYPSNGLVRGMWDHKNLSWVWGWDRKIRFLRSSFVIIRQASIVMPNSDLQDGIFYPIIKRIRYYFFAYHKKRIFIFKKKAPRISMLKWHNHVMSHLRYDTTWWCHFKITMTSLVFRSATVHFYPSHGLVQGMWDK